MLTSWWAWIQFLAGALERVVGELGYSSERAHLNGCALGLDFRAVAPEPVRLPVGGLGYSSERVRLNGCAYQLVGLDTALSGCT